VRLNWSGKPAWSESGVVDDGRGVGVDDGFVVSLTMMKRAMAKTRAAADRRIAILLQQRQDPLNNTCG
jgi:hypothetical protein